VRISVQSEALPLNKKIWDKQELSVEIVVLSTLHMINFALTVGLNSQAVLLALIPAYPQVRPLQSIPVVVAQQEH
jgi:hypothetical protein